MSHSALSNRSFLIYLIGSSVSLHGLWIYRVALGWSTWELTASEFWVGIVAFTQFAPAVIFGPLFGVLADRFDSRKASILINTLCVLNMLVLGVLTILGKVDIAVLITQSLVQGALDGAHTPVRMTLIPGIVARPALQNAIAVTSISFNVSRFIGPAIAGIVIATQGVGSAFIVNGVSYLAIIVAVLFVKLQPTIARDKQPSDVWAELLDGFRYALAHKTIRVLLITIAVASVFGRGALEMMPAFADSVFERGASGLAMLTAAIGVGAVISGLILSRNSAWLNSNVVRLSVVLSGFLVAAFAINTHFWIALPIVTALGVLLSLSGIGSQILIQTLVDDEVRGRVSSFWGMIAFGGTASGSLIVGAAATAFGLRETVVLTGLLCAVVALLSPRH